MKWMNSLTARLFAILAIGLITVQTVSFVGFMIVRGKDSKEQMHQFLGADAAFVFEFMRSLPPEKRAEWLPKLNRGYYRFTLQNVPTEGFSNKVCQSCVSDVTQLLTKHLPSHTNITCRLPPPPNDKEVVQILLALDQHQALMLELTNPFAAPPMAALVLYLITILAAITPFVAWAVRQTTHRIERMLETIDRFGRNINTPPVIISGTSELKRAALAFNTMRERILKHVEERTQILAAIAHDLQTPLTRLRLRVEQVGEEKVRNKLASDIDLMGSLISEGIDFARSANVQEPRQAIEINHWLEGMVDNYTDMGHACSLTGTAAQPYTGAIRALTRVMQNLISNAIKYGGNALIEIKDSPDTLCIKVCDNGPGINPEQLSQVFEPFFRTEQSRNRETGGSGLGLSIARNLIQAHGGNIHLTNRPQGGIEATITLPRR